jgi:hypothetical protein
MSKPIAPQRTEKGEESQAIGRSRGGRTSKIHALADHRGRPVAFALTPGNGWAFFGVGWTFLFVAGCQLQLGGDIAGEGDGL